VRVKIKLHATLRKFLPAGSDADGAMLDVADGATVGEVIDRLGIPPKHAGMLVSGEEFLEVTSVLRDGQELSIFPPMAGGIC
jgi:molybdopterin synthase sulfur carrier subunit